MRTDDLSNQPSRPNSTKWRLRASAEYFRGQPQVSQQWLFDLRRVAPPVNMKIPLRVSRCRSECDGGNPKSDRFNAAIHEFADSRNGAPPTRPALIETRLLTRLAVFTECAISVKCCITPKPQVACSGRDPDRLPTTPPLTRNPIRTLQPAIHNSSH